MEPSTRLPFSHRNQRTSSLPPPSSSLSPILLPDDSKEKRLVQPHILSDEEEDDGQLFGPEKPTTIINKTVMINQKQQQQQNIHLHPHPRHHFHHHHHNHLIDCNQKPRAFLQRPTLRPFKQAGSVLDRTCLIISPSLSHGSSVIKKKTVRSTNIFDNVLLLLLSKCHHNCVEHQHPSDHNHAHHQLELPIITIMMLYLIVCYCGTCDARVRIQQIKVPRYVENGTRESVVLDCPYTLDPELDRNLVVKWFFNDDPEPIYQWIVEHNLRRVPQRYHGKINANYIVPNQTAQPWQQYRALNLIRPTVEMSGRYLCYIISIINEDSDAGSMVVYAKTKSIDLVTRRVSREKSPALLQQQQSDHPSGGSAWPSSSGVAGSWSSSWLFDGNNNLIAPAAPSPSYASSSPSSIDLNQSKSLSDSRPTSSVASSMATEVECSVDNVYPLPELTIYQVLRGDGGKQRPRSLERATVRSNTTQLANGAFRASVVVTIDDVDLLTMMMMDDQIIAATTTTTIKQYQQTSQSQQQEAAELQNGLSGNQNIRHKTMVQAMFECLVSQDDIKHELRNNTIYMASEPWTFKQPTDHASSIKINGKVFLSAIVVCCFLSLVLPSYHN